MKDLTTKTTAQIKRIVRHNEKTKSGGVRLITRAQWLVVSDAIRFGCTRSDSVDQYIVGGTIEYVVVMD